MKNTPKNTTLCLIAAGFWLIVCGAAGIGCSSSNKTGGNGIDKYVSAVHAYESGDRDRAVADLVVATRTSPDLVMARVMLGDLYRADGEYDNAATQYEVLVKLDPYNWSNFYKLGVTYQFLQRLQDAQDSYEQALKLNPDDANSSMNLGLVQLYLGDRAAAVKFTEKATLLDPQSAAAFSNFGVALDANGEHARAEAAYRHSLDLDPENTTTLLNLGTNLISQNKGAEAVHIMDRVVQKQNTPLHRKRYGDALAKAGKFADAIRQYEAALKLDPKYYSAQNDIGWTYIAEYRANLELDDTKRRQAIAAWNKSLLMKPDQPRIVAARKDWTEKALFRK